MLFNVLQVKAMMVPFASLLQLFLLLFSTSPSLILLLPLCATSPVPDVSRDKVGQAVPLNWSHIDSFSPLTTTVQHHYYNNSSSNSNNSDQSNKYYTSSRPFSPSTSTSTYSPTDDSSTLEDTFTSPSPDLLYRPSALTPEINLNSGGTPDCLSKTSDSYCESVSDYPSIDLRKEIKMSPNEFREMFGQTVMDGRKSYVDDESGDEERVCRRIPRIIYPRMARSSANNQWLFIVNDAEYTQPVIIEQCE